MKWTPRLESAFKRLKDSTSNTDTTLLPEELATMTKVDDILQRCDSNTTSPLKDVAPKDLKGKKTDSLEPELVECVDMSLIGKVSKLLLKYGAAEGADGNQKDYIHDMIRGSFSPELERIMDKVKAQIAEKEYQRMVASVDPHSSHNSSLGANLSQDLKDVRSHTLGIVNVLYTGVAVFAAVYLISGHFVQDLGMRVLLSFFAFVFIVACEAYLYTRHTSIANELTPDRRKRTARSSSKDTVTTTTSFSKVKLD
ncbi:hypothetical protein BGW38_000609 [Lunasporangiospora selenospora]|uniref:Uncharacterized protein n=1 Tax=Lunasporangiospora selenospora TaxID=979761 RepID=A0A9P6KE27_9FUNG|nr:hypothetical protein BGW38_000609 [Lunasporangiospora selenospora]